jgi:hypothetical protein
MLPQAIARKHSNRLKGVIKASGSRPGQNRFRERLGLPDNLFLPPKGLGQIEELHVKPPTGPPNST